MHTIVLVVATLLAGQGSGAPELPADLDVVCGREMASSRQELLRVEDRWSVAVRDRAKDPSAWLALACTRARLEFAGGIGRPGPEMASGDPWAAGAIKAAIRAIALAPTSVASEVLGLVALRERSDELPSSLLSAVNRAVDAGVRTSALLRACAQYASDRGKDGTAVRCARLGLANGTDSTFHLLRLSRLAYRARDPRSGEQTFLAAAEAARGTSAREELTWHLQWFLTPEELRAWDLVPDGMTRSWVRDRLTIRDIRDARAPGSRLTAHFERLEYASAHFVLRLPRHLRQGTGLVGATPESGGGENPDIMGYACEPGEVPAPPFRYFQRWQQWLDDRGAVWLRFGAPLQRIRARPGCFRAAAGLVGDATGAIARDRMPIAVGKAEVAEPGANVREAWTYVVDGRMLLLHFENERFDGSVEATRLVAGVLGSYLCDVDATRCLETERAKRASRDASHEGRVPVERLAELRGLDLGDIAIATESDDNAVRTPRRMAVRATPYRLWDPESLVMKTLVTWAIPAADAAPVRNGRRMPSPLRFEVRLWSSGAGEWNDSAFVRPPGATDTASTRGVLGGALVMPGGAETTAWSVAVVHPDGARGRSWGDGVAPIGKSPLMISDLVLGSRSQGTTTRFGQVAIPIAPLGAFARAEPATLFFQLLAEAPLSSGTLQLRFYREEDRPRVPPATALEITVPLEIQVGLNPIERDVSFAQLEAGRYRIEVRVLSPARVELVARSQRFVVHE
jgi:hypothetical protein